MTISVATIFSAIRLTAVKEVHFQAFSSARKGLGDLLRAFLAQTGFIPSSLRGKVDFLGFYFLMLPNVEQVALARMPEAL